MPGDRPERQGVLLTGRSEYLSWEGPTAETTAGSAYAEAGADCLYPAGIGGREEIAPAVKAVVPKPVNVLVGSDFTTVDELAKLGVRRISVGGALARAAWGGFLQAAREIASEGKFTGLAKAAPWDEVEGIFE